MQLKLSGQLKGAAVLLCNDRGGSFGAPDVLEVILDQVALEHALDARFSDRPPDQVLHRLLRHPDVERQIAPVIISSNKKTPHRSMIKLGLTGRLAGAGLRGTTSWALLGF